MHAVARLGGAIVLTALCMLAVALLAAEPMPVLVQSASAQSEE